jgi:cell wall assembly regulator SMI1
MKPETILKLEREFEQFPFLRAETAATEEEIEAASHAISVGLPLDYRHFLMRFGGAIVGAYPIFGLKPVAAMGNRWSVIEVNRRYRSDGWPSIEDWLVISADAAGNPIGIDGDGRIRLWDHDFGAVIEIAPNFDEFVIQCLRGT